MCSRESGRADSNRGPLGPEPSALAKLRYAPIGFVKEFFYGDPEEFLKNSLHSGEPARALTPAIFYMAGLIRNMIYVASLHKSFAH